MNKSLFFTVQLADAEAGGIRSIFDRVKTIPQDFTPLFKLWEKDYEETEKKIFKNKGSFEGGTAWPALSRKYYAWKQKSKWAHNADNILILSGGLIMSITVKSAPGAIREMTKNTLTLGTSLKVPGGKYNLGMIHQMGWGRVPMRKSVYMSEPQKKRWMTMARKWLNDLVVKEAEKEKGRIRAVEGYYKEGIGKPA